MITVIAGTNRKNSKARRYAELYCRIFIENGAQAQMLDLADLPIDVFHPEMYGPAGQSESLKKVQEKYLIKADKLFFVVSEYNGSFPGALKMFIDACSVKNAQESFYGKKAGIVGISAGRAGNLRGMDHLAAILNYLKISVLPNKLPISLIESLNDTEGRLIDKATLNVIDQQVKDFVAF